MAETGRGQLFHLISKGNSRVFYKKDYYTNKKSCPDSNRNPESNSITLRVFVENMLRHNADRFYSVYSPKLVQALSKIKL
jgi:hypothetical protein